MRCQSTFQVQDEDTDDTSFKVSSSEEGQAEIGRSSMEGHTAGCHEKAQVRYPCSWMAALCGAP